MSSRKRVYLHVGAPKTGTTFLQHVLFANRDRLAEDGVLYPYDTFGDSFRSTLDLRGISWGAHRRRDLRGSWAEVAARTRDWDGHTVVVSNELLGGARPRRIARALKSVQPAEVHVVFTARDLARQLVSDWQEHVKHRHTITLEEFVEELLEHGLRAREPFGEMFWGLHDAAHVLGRWAEQVPVERVHVVTVPQPGAAGEGLWERFARVVGLDAAAYDTDVPRSNVSMGVVETELVRRLNLELQDVGMPEYQRLVRVHLAEEVLGRRSARLTLPPQFLDRVEERSRTLVAQLRDAGYPVEGDLAELMPVRADHLDHVSPTGLTDADLAEPALRVATAMVRRATRQQRQIRRLRGGRGSSPGDRRLRLPEPVGRAASSVLRRVRGAG
jgi:hypothetical protein